MPKTNIAIIWIVTFAWYLAYCNIFIKCLTLIRFIIGLSSIMLTTEPTMVSTFGASKLISFSHMMSFRRPFLDSHLENGYDLMDLLVIILALMACVISYEEKWAQIENILLTQNPSTFCARKLNNVLV